MNQKLESTYKKLEAIKHISPTGIEYWRARELQRALEYATWEHFGNVIEKARVACEGAGYDPKFQFRETTKLVRRGRGRGSDASILDYFLTRGACYLIAMNGDTTKEVIAEAQVYFASQTWKQEQLEQTINERKRLIQRKRLTVATKKLSDVAYNAGVTSEKFGIFHNAGHRGFYHMNLSEVMTHKGLDPKKDKLFDRVGREELAAHEFRATQTEAKLVRENIKQEYKAINVHREVGEGVRKAIEKLGGTMPEDLPAEPPIKQIEQKHKKLGIPLPALPE